MKSKIKLYSVALLLVVVCVLKLLSSSDAHAPVQIIDLNNSNFEDFTEIGVDGDTGDWLLSFCSYRVKPCQLLEPILSKVAASVGAEVTVARVDVHSNRELARRFEIREYPTIMFISKAQSFQYKGKFSVEDISHFALEGYSLLPPRDINPSPGIFGEILLTYRLALLKASNDIWRGRFFTTDLILSLLPIIFMIVIAMVLWAPLPESRYDAEFRRQRKHVEMFWTRRQKKDKSSHKPH